MKQWMWHLEAENRAPELESCSTPMGFNPEALKPRIFQGEMTRLLQPILQVPIPYTSLRSTGMVESGAFLQLEA